MKSSFRILLFAASALVILHRGVMVTARAQMNCIGKTFCCNTGLNNSSEPQCNECCSGGQQYQEVPTSATGSGNQSTLPTGAAECGSASNCEKQVTCGTANYDVAFTDSTCPSLVGGKCYGPLDCGGNACVNGTCCASNYLTLCTNKCGSTTTRLCDGSCPDDCDDSANCSGGQYPCVNGCCQNCSSLEGQECADDPCGACAWYDCDGNCDDSGCDPDCGGGNGGCSPMTGDGCGNCGTIDCDGTTCYDPCGGGDDPCENCYYPYSCVFYSNEPFCIDFIDPILIDLSGDGFRMTDTKGGVSFDFFGGGQPLLTSWTAAGASNGWLALDRNHDGRINNGQELFGNATPQPGPAVQHTGFAGIAQFDALRNGGNGDGVIDAKDAVFQRLLIWVDKNHNGTTEPGELMSLKQAGIKSISLDYKDAHFTDAYGNQFRYRTQVTWADPKRNGKQHWAYDVVLVSPSLPGIAGNTGNK